MLSSLGGRINQIDLDDCRLEARQGRPGDLLHMPMSREYFNERCVYFNRSSRHDFLLIHDPYAFAYKPENEKTNGPYSPGTGRQGWAPASCMIQARQLSSRGGGGGGAGPRLRVRGSNGEISRYIMELVRKPLQELLESSATAALVHATVQGSMGLVVLKARKE
jgi:hypothetical protein